MIHMIAFDADDTLWHNEILYAQSQDRLKQLLSPYQCAEWVEQKLYEVEMRNLEYYGYGIKSFTLSMIETAIEASHGNIPAKGIREILGFARDMLHAPVQLLDHVAEVIPSLAKDYALMLITKGDLLDQQRKIARSGLENYFKIIEIVKDKNEETYAALLSRHHIAPKHLLMVGNSLRSDVLPIAILGGYAVYIPYHMVWEHETADIELVELERYYQLDHIGQLPGLLVDINRRLTIAVGS